MGVYVGCASPVGKRENGSGQGPSPVSPQMPRRNLEAGMAEGGEQAIEDAADGDKAASNRRRLDRQNRRLRLLRANPQVDR